MGASYDVAVIGAGAAGFLAATQSAQRGRRTVLVEKNRKPGVKILMSGGTRCNLTHAADRRDIVEAFGSQGPFLHSALAALSPDDLVALFNAEGVATKVEPGGKIFPVSDRAVDVLEALRRLLDRSGAELRLESPVIGIERVQDSFVVATRRGPIAASSVVLAVGGQSYPGCGTAGDGYAWAKALGHTIVPPRPALVPLVSPERWVHELRGVTLPDVQVGLLAAGDVIGASAATTATKGTSESPSTDGANFPRQAPLSNPSPGPSPRGRAKEDVSRRGSFLFTHFGLSGPVVMDLSRAVTERPQAGGWQATCDVAPALTERQLAERFAAETSGGKRTIVTLLAELVPRRLAEALLVRAGVAADQRLAELSRHHRQLVMQALKRTTIGIDGSLGFKKAEVTAGGVSLAEVDSRTMESKLTPGLYLAGEVLDLDGPIGGYNFQAAFSTGWLAGRHA